MESHSFGIPQNDSAIKASISILREADCLGQCAAKDSFRLSFFNCRFQFKCFRF